MLNKKKYLGIFVMVLVLFVGVMFNCDLNNDNNNIDNDLNNNDDNIDNNSNNLLKIIIPNITGKYESATIFIGNDEKFVAMGNAIIKNGTLTVSLFEEINNFECLCVIIDNCCVSGFCSCGGMTNNAWTKKGLYSI